MERNLKPCTASVEQGLAELQLRVDCLREDILAITDLLYGPDPPVKGVVEETPSSPGGFMGDLAVNVGQISNQVLSLSRRTSTLRSLLEGSDREIVATDEKHGYR